MRPTRLALVPGEPAGVGPELCVRLAQRPRDYELIVFADPRSLRAAAEALSLPIALVAPEPGVGFLGRFGDSIAILLIVILNAIADLIHAALDPRVRVGGLR